MNNNLALIKGGIHVDGRGEVSFVNDFNFDKIKRFYVVSNHISGFIRAWHGHKLESKYVSVVSGAALIGAVRIDNWTNPSPDLEVSTFILSDKNPSILYIPPGYANGFMSLCQNTKLIFYSTSTIHESLNDDYRFPSRYWDIWNIEEK